MEKKELQEALQAHKEAMDAQVLAIKEASEKEVTALKAELTEMEKTKSVMQTQLDAIALEQEKAKHIPSKETKSFADDLKESLTKEIDSLAKIKGLNGGSMTMQVKSFLETVNASVTTGSLIPKPQFDVGISKAPDRMPFMLEIVAKGIANSLTIYWTQRKTRTDNSGFVTEGTLTTLEAGTVTESVLGYETKSASMQNLTAFIKVSNNSIDDIEWLISEVQTELTVLHVLKIDAAILNGTVAVNGWDGINTVATAFSAGGSTLASGVTPNKFDALVFALTQIEIANFRANYIVLNPADVRDMKLTRDDNGAYMLPPQMANSGTVTVDGVRIISNTGVTKGSYLVGDFTKAKFWTRKGMELKIYDQNEDDAIKQLKTVALYSRGTLIVKASDKLAFVKDTFADTITEITAA